jgi:elongation factor Ts
MTAACFDERNITMQITAAMVKELRERSGAGMRECKKALTRNDGDIDTAVEWLRKQGLAKADKKADRIAAEGRIALAQSGGTGVLVEINSETDFVAKDENFLRFADEVAQAALENNADDVETLKISKLAGGTVEEVRQGLVAKVGENVQVRRLVRIDDAPNLGAYVHGGRIGVLVALEGGDPELARGLAMHIAAMNPRYIAPENVPADFVAKEKEISLAQMSDKDKAKPAEIQEKMIAGKIRKTLNEISLTGQPFVLDTNATVGEALTKAKAKVLSFHRIEVGEGIEKVVEDYAAEVMKQAGLA